MVTVSRTRLTPNHVEMLIILKDNGRRIEEFKLSTSYKIVNKDVVMKGAVEIIEVAGPVSEGSGVFGDDGGEELDSSSDEGSDEEDGFEDLLGLDD